MGQHSCACASNAHADQKKRVGLENWRHSSILPLRDCDEAFDLCVASAFGSLSAQKPVWQPSPGPTQVPIWPGRVPGAAPGKEWLVAGRPAVGVSNVSRPRMRESVPLSFARN